jgi:hypothetical protein
MSETTLKDLLDAMPSIAKAVNIFSSDAVQQKAFAVLMNALGVEAEVEESKERPARKTKIKRVTKRAATTDKVAKPRKAQAGPPKFKSELNLRPKGKKSLKDFVAEKKPKTNEERFAVMIYYLEKTLQEKTIDRNHIYTCFKELNVKFPLQIDAVLRNAARRKGWFDTSNSSDLRITTRGENFVEHDLPATDGAKK